MNPVVIEGNNGQRSCPSSDTLESARNDLKEDIYQELTLELNSPCGGIGWAPVVSLDLEDPAHTCPSPWIESATPARSCVAPENINICPGLSFPVSGLTYNRVCGRAVGYAASSVDAFDDYRNLNDIDLPYFNGVSVTHGSPRLHIWSFAAGHGSRCPCENGGGRLPHTFVGDNYFCDGSYNGALWDGLDCTTACCTFNSPPWFNVTLPAPSSALINILETKMFTFAFWNFLYNEKKLIAT